MGHRAPLGIGTTGAPLAAVPIVAVDEDCHALGLEYDIERG